MATPSIITHKMAPLVAKPSKSFKTEHGNFGGLAKAYNLSSQICIVSSSGTLVKSELTSKEHIYSPLWLYVLAHSAKLKESLTVNWLVEMSLLAEIISKNITTV